MQAGTGGGAMEQQWLSVFGDPRLMEIAVCLAVIGVLRWISLRQ